jgi:hypothetical protein
MTQSSNAQNLPFRTFRFRNLNLFRISDLGFRILIPLLLAGCMTEPQHPAATQPSTLNKPQATTQPAFWYDQPPAATVDSEDFQKLWDSCEAVARDFLFKLDRTDYRTGVLTTVPMATSQWFEPWRRDARTGNDVEESSLATIRRSIRFEFVRQADNTWQVAPKVLVERLSVTEQRITSVVLYRQVFTPVVSPRHRPTGTHESDAGIMLDERYWYPLRRDTEFERDIAAAVREKLH